MTMFYSRLTETLGISPGTYDLKRKSSVTEPHSGRAPANVHFDFVCAHGTANFALFQSTNTHPCTPEHPAYNLAGNWWAGWQAWELTWPLDLPGKHWHCTSLFCRSHLWSTSLTKTASQMHLGGTEEYDIRNCTVLWMSWPGQTRENTDLVLLRKKNLPRFCWETQSALH